MKDLQHFKDEMAKQACYGYSDWEHMEIMLGDKNNDFTAERLLEATFNWALQFSERERLLNLISK